MDPATGAAFKVAALATTAGDSVAKEAGGLISRLFGPAADVMGENWAERLKQRNLSRLLEKTEKRAEGVGSPGFANPRVASQVFEAASYANDEFVAEYLSGVLASSRSETGNDDSGLMWSSTVARLPAEALRLHYMLYECIQRAVSNGTYEKVSDLHTVAFTVDLLGVYSNMGGVSFQERLPDVLECLMREELIGPTYYYGTIGAIMDDDPRKGTHGVTLPWPFVLKFGVTIHGIRMFMWGLGKGAASRDEFLVPDLGTSLTESALTPVPLPLAIGFEAALTRKEADPAT